MLATIIGSSGSTPLPPGSSMLIRQTGKTVLGTIGGGEVEAKAITEMNDFSAGNVNSITRRFALSDDSSGEGMICGGTIDVLIERIRPEELSVYFELISVREAGGDCALLRGVDLSIKNVQRVLVAGTSQEALEHSQCADLIRAQGIDAERFLPSLQRAYREESVERVSGVRGELIIQPIAGLQPLVIFGGGHIGRSLSKIASLAGFSVTVVDEREEYSMYSRFPEAAKTISKSWIAAFEEVKISPTTSIVIVTSGHKSDGEVLRHAVTTRARYVGMIGSRKKVAATFSRLVKDGVTREALQRVHAPIGLNIGAVTAEEIVVSILAELIRARRGFREESAPMSSQMISWFDHPEA